MAVVSHADESAGRTGSILLGLLAALVLAILLLAIWSLVSAGAASRALVPSPLDAVRAFVVLLGDPAAWHSTAHTLGAWLAAFVIAGIAAAAIGTLVGRSRRGRGFFAPSLTLFGAFPVVALVPLGLLAFGMKSHVPAIAAGALLAFFPAAAAIAHGQASPAPDQRLRALFRGLEIAALLALSGVVFAEMLFGIDNIGGAIIASAQAFLTVKLFAQILWLWALGVAIALPFALLRWAIRPRR
jgi:NitT/TauT family transport system permease protein